MIDLTVPDPVPEGRLARAEKLRRAEPDAFSTEACEFDLDRKHSISLDDGSANVNVGVSVRALGGINRSSQHVSSSSRRDGKRALEHAATVQLEKRRRVGVDARSTGSRVGTVESVPRSLGTSSFVRELSRTGAELINGETADFVVLHPADTSHVAGQHPVRVGRLVGDPRRDQLAIDRLLGRVCRN